jgi:aryl-alcohol dehydrogenase-like predicted oxidoreductase
LESDSRPETIRKSLEGSLKRLDTDYTDLYYQHRVDPNVPAEEVAGMVGELIKEGKVRFFGVSGADESYIRRAHSVCPLTAIQNRYSMMSREGDALFPALEELCIGYIAFSPLANGILSDRYGKDSTFEQGTDFRSFMPQYKPEAFDENAELFEYIRSLARQKNCTPAQISLAWIICKKPFMVVIPGTRKPDRLKENAEAADI